MHKNTYCQLPSAPASSNFLGSYIYRTRDSASRKRHTHRCLHAASCVTIQGGDLGAIPARRIRAAAIATGVMGLCTIGHRLAALSQCMWHSCAKKMTWEKLYKPCEYWKSGCFFMPRTRLRACQYERPCSTIVRSFVARCLLYVLLLHSVLTMARGIYRRLFKK
jgi:hypothetical protein